MLARRRRELIAEHVLRHGSARVSDLTDFRGKIPPEQEKEVRALFARIQKGEVKVPVKLHPVK